MVKVESEHLLELIKELDGALNGKEELKRSGHSEATKVIFHKLFDYDQAFREFMISATAVCLGMMLWDQEGMYVRTMSLFRMLTLQLESIAMSEQEGGN